MFISPVVSGKMMFPSSFLPTQPITNLIFFFPLKSLSLGRCMVFHLGLNSPKSLTLLKLSSCGSLC